MDSENVITEAIEYLNWYFTQDDGMADKTAVKAWEVLLREQEAKTGYWIDSAGYDKCSICGAEYSDLYPDYSNTHFCPNCGAKMKSGEVK